MSTLERETSGTAEVEESVLEDTTDKPSQPFSGSPSLRLNKPKVGNFFLVIIVLIIVVACFIYYFNVYRPQTQASKQMYTPRPQRRAAAEEYDY